LVHIAGCAEEFITLAQKELSQKDKTTWRTKVDRFIANDSWDNTVYKMRRLIYETIAEKKIIQKRKQASPVTEHYMLKGLLPAAS
ncbi:MAG: hypothetical protein J7497_11565, partial [Chitinophagaceae bacterium]|nr:hypothetical protein [Chitinophagaceae bacterium]